ncbi:MAG: ABC transporter permease [Candidatus Afipia apatlaquensis]|uniref:ABC transporter permease n=1 Tax=Candidatus Afipia apatlaquensis TaxID=2712852 RepID=A0A7C9VQ93_9BRAD|nr:ABC transporter permease [Candidatus Afipia apatlaquensis]
MSFYFVQFLTGLASAASLFLVASGLSIIFGVTRIVNFAHGAFYMLGAYVAFTLTERLSGALGFWGGVVAAALIVAVLGVLVEMVLLRRIYKSPELFQLLATFGLTLMVEDIVVLIWGPDDLVGRRAPGFRGAVDFFGQNIPSYDLFLIVLGPAVLGALWLLFRRTRWGILVRAATQDRDMVAALGVNQKWLFTSVFAVGVFLAALGGALQIPRDAVHHAMDLRIIVDVFVVVVIGGLGSITGAFVAAVLVSELNAFGILIFPKISIILVFLVMAAVLIVRPWGLFGKPEAVARKTPGLSVRPWRPLTMNERFAMLAVVIVASMLPLFGGNYALAVGAEIAIFVIFAASLHFLMSVGGLASFGHAAYFGLGAYGVAFFAKAAGLPMIACLLLGPLLGLVGAAIFGFFAVQLSGVYFAMLTLAFAQIVWSIAFQWVGVTGGDNGILGVWPDAWAAGSVHFYWLSLGIATIAVLLLRVIVFSPFGYALRATRDSALRSEAIGIDGKRIQWTAFVIAGTVAGVAGALFAYLKGSVFPDSLGISLSVDALVMVLLGGVETVSGAVVGAIVFKALNIWLVSQTDWSKLVLGAVIVLIVVAFPKGIVGMLETIRTRRKPDTSKPAMLASRIESAE